jgi:Lrp/AsnC family leucine-responsive transcriptional regulator
MVFSDKIKIYSIYSGVDMEIDATDIKILNILRKNSRVSASLISQRINMSLSAVSERIKKLETSGIIKQYTAILDSKKLGKDTTAFISVRLEHPKFNDHFTENVRNHPEIIECYYLTGDFDYLLKVITSSTEMLSEILNFIKSIKGVSLTKTVVVLSTVKNNFSCPPD